MDDRGAPGILLVLSAPSGTGKSSLAQRLLTADPEVEFSVSYTTRPRREGERDGREYHFVDDVRFDAMVANGDFLEWAHVFGKRYGTGREATRGALARGRDVLLDIDVQGARQIRSSGVDAVFVFVLPPDFDTLEGRLRARRTEGEADLAQRLRVARQEAQEYPRYDYLVINGDLERALDEIRSIVRAERQKVARRRGEAQRIVATFP